MLNESPDKLKLKNRVYPWYLGTTFFVYKTPTGKTNYVSSTSSGIDFTLKVNGMDFSKFVPVEMRTQLDHENLVEVLHSLNEKLINKNENRKSFVASGRLWSVNGQNYVSFWNERANVQKSIVDKLLLYLNITYDNTLFEFPSNQNDYKPYDKIGIPTIITKNIDLIPHLDTPMIPAAYARELRRLKSMKELTQKQWLDNQSTGLGDPKHPVNHENPHVNKLTAENAEMAQSDITKIIDYSEKLQSMFTVNDNLEDWVKAKLNHACDYVATVRDYLKFYSDEKEAGASDEKLCKKNKLIKEFNSSMAMGALKQLNSDAKELESMLQPTTQLDDWVKAKLNLAGEYLDDVYHHLDHFGPQGRNLDEILYLTGKHIPTDEPLDDYQRPALLKLLAKLKGELKKESYYDDKKLARMMRDKIKEAVMNPSFKLNMMNLKNLDTDKLEKMILTRQKTKEKKQPIVIKHGYWIDTDGKIIKVNDHEKWAKEKYPSSSNPKLEAFKNGYVRMVYDDTRNKYDFQNMEDGSWEPRGNSILGIPPVNSKIELAIIQFMKEKDISESSWKGEEERSQDIERQRSMSWPTDTKIWITPKGTVEVVKYQKHEDWIKHNDSSLIGYGPDATYLNAIKKGYIKGSIQYGMMSLSNLENYNFSLRGGEDTPPVSTKIKDALVKFIEEKNIQIISSGGGGRSFFDKHTLEPTGSKLPDDLDESTENPVSDLEITKKYIQYAKNTIKYLEILKAIKDKFRRKDDISKAIRIAAENQNIDPNYITLSAVKSILIGLGERNNFTNLNPSDRVIAMKLQGLSSVTLSHNDGILIKILDLLESNHLDEDLKKTLGALGVAGSLALGSLGIGQGQAATPAVNKQVAKVQKVAKNIDKSSLRPDEVKLLGGRLSDYIGHWEGKKYKQYKDSSNLPTVGIGHYLTNTKEDRDLFKSLFGSAVDYDKVLNGKQSLDDNQIEKLFNVDVKIKEKLANKKIGKFIGLPQYIKNAIINALYRGDLGPATVTLINNGDWEGASKEYLNHTNARSGPDQIKRRMKTNALAFSHFGEQNSQK